MLTGKNIVCYYFLLVLTFLPRTVFSQEIDSTKNSLPKKNRSFLQFLLRPITRSGIDSSVQPGVLINKNEASFLPYEGKGIRNIVVREFGFEKTFVDTTREINYFGKDFITHLHKNTKEWVIRNNLFIKERTALNANLVADNERHLRSLDYIHDARILVNTIANEPDSVDLIVITKDFLSITLQLNDANKNRFKTKVGDANLLGTAQNIQFTTLLEKKREPHVGYEMRYRLNSIANTFINATIGYSTINHDLYNGALDEQGWHAGIERPLVSQYLHIAGALVLAHHQSYNNYLRPDSLFYKYDYNTFDAWIGYNLGVRKFLRLKTVLNRQFISIRYYSIKFSKMPYQVNHGFNFRFNDREAILAQFTFFKQDFYKTNYVFGFGITEDVPYGYNVALTAGWYKQLHMERPYAGVDANLYTVTNKSNVMQYFFRTGAFLNKNNIQDAAILIGASSFSRVHTYKNFKLRHYLRFSYTRQFNRVGLEPLFIKNIFGLRYIALDSASGNQRFSLHTETIFFIKLKLLGFKFAPFASADFAHFTPEHKNTSHSGFYPGFGGGIRTRNENILLGTIELRFMYFPRKSEQHSAFKFTFSTNLRSRYNSSYVKAPDIIQVNSDFDNNIY